MYKEFPEVFEKPENEDARIWRYVDFSKFVSLLEHRSLFFPRADKLGDPFEGSFPRGNVILRPVTYKDVPKDKLDTISEYYRLFVKFTVISCWHLNEYESAAMWKHYLKSDDGIAIRSTFNRLKNSLLDENQTIYIGKVKYIDYKKDLLKREGSLNIFVHKRKSFEHEQELRAIIQSIPVKKRGKYKGEPDFDKPICEDGIYVAVNLDTLIERIYLAPTCAKWFFGLVESLIKRYGLDKQVLQSSLDDEPVY